MPIDKDLFYNTLCQTLDPRRGEFQPIDNTNEAGREIVLDIKWKGGIHFVVRKCRHLRYGWYYVMRDMQELSNIYIIKMPGDDDLRIMQHIIDDVDSGKYKNKKTLSERIKSYVVEKNLVSCMNNTKWHELINELLENAPEPCDCVQYKTLFEDFVPDYFWDLRHDEDIEHMNLSLIEWMKIKHVQTVHEFRGLLLSDKTYTYDYKPFFEEILQKYSIPYEYDETEQTFTIYGYR